MDDGGVGFVDLPFAEQARQLALHLRAAGKEQQAGGRHVEAMYDQRIGKSCLHTRCKTVRFLRSAPWHRQQAGAHALAQGVDGRVVDADHQHRALLLGLYQCLCVHALVSPLVW